MGSTTHTVVRYLRASTLKVDLRRYYLVEGTINISGGKDIHTPGGSDATLYKHTAGYTTYVVRWLSYQGLGQ